jgi:hypothetical protein
MSRRGGYLGLGDENGRSSLTIPPVIRRALRSAAEELLPTHLVSPVKRAAHVPASRYRRGECVYTYIHINIYRLWYYVYAHNPLIYNHSFRRYIHIYIHYKHIYSECISRTAGDKKKKDIYISFSLFSSASWPDSGGVRVVYTIAVICHKMCYIWYIHITYIYMLSRLDIEAGPYDTRRSYIWKHIWDVTHLYPYIWLNISQLEKHTIYMDMNIHIYISYI